MQTQTYMHPPTSEFIRGYIAQCERKRYLAKAVIVAQGAVSRDLFFVIKGAVTVRLRTPSGHDLVVATSHVGDFFGEAGLFEAEAVNTSGVRAKSACEIARLSHAHLHANPALLTALLPLLAPQLAVRLEGLYRRTAEMAFYDTQTRVTTALRELASAPDARPHPDGSAISVTRTELGAMTGASREAVGRVLIRLQQQGTLRANGRAMIVLKAGAGAARELPSRARHAAASVSALR